MQLVERRRQLRRDRRAPRERQAVWTPPPHARGQRLRPRELAQHPQHRQPRSRTRAARPKLGRICSRLEAPLELRHFCWRWTTGALISFSTRSGWPCDDDPKRATGAPTREALARRKTAWPARRAARPADGDSAPIVGAHGSPRAQTVLRQFEQARSMARQYARGHYNRPRIARGLRALDRPYGGSNRPRNTRSHGCRPSRRIA